MGTAIAHHGTAAAGRQPRKSAAAAGGVAHQADSVFFSRPSAMVKEARW